jgi:hypothetical protein
MHTAQSSQTYVAALPPHPLADCSLKVPGLGMEIEHKRGTDEMQHVTQGQWKAKGSPQSRLWPCQQLQSSCFSWAPSLRLKMFGLCPCTVWVVVEQLTFRDYGCLQ